MGLAASQARFLAITARKMNCEFQSMQIAQEKLSVTRDLQKAAQDYQNSLDATKLVWDTQDNYQYDLSYDVMMTPSVLNEYDPYLITDIQGRILLTDTMFNAAVKAGVIDATGKPSGKTTSGNFVYDGDKVDVTRTIDSTTYDGSRNAFIKALTECNNIDGSTADSIISLGSKGYTKSGIGGQIYDKTTANALPTETFISYMQEVTYEEAMQQGLPIPEEYKNENKTDKIYALNLLKQEGTKLKLGDLEFVSRESDFGNKKFMIVSNGKYLNENSVKDLTVGDILSGKYEIVFKRDLGTVDGKQETKKAVQDIYDAVVSAVNEALGGGDNVGANYKGLNVDNESYLALNQAQAFTELNRSKYTNVNSQTLSNLYNKAIETNTLIQGSDNRYAFSLTNLAKCFLTNFAIAIDGFNSEYNIEYESAKKSYYVTNDSSYYFLLKNEAALTDRAMLNADFYNILYNQLATNGAISDSNVRDLYTTDKISMQNAVKNGNLYISTLHDDGYYYQGAYTLSGHVTEVTDDDAIARAEIEYTTQKTKLNTKEESLELQMKNLDMEISALTTEFDTVKNLISKGVEKVFTMFST